MGKGRTKGEQIGKRELRPSAAVINTTGIQTPWRDVSVALRCESGPKGTRSGFRRDSGARRVTHLKREGQAVARPLGDASEINRLASG